MTFCELRASSRAATMSSSKYCARSGVRCGACGLCRLLCRRKGSFFIFYFLFVIFYLPFCVLLFKAAAPNKKSQRENRKCCRTLLDPFVFAAVDFAVGN